MVIREVNINISRVKSSDGAKWFQLDINKNEENDHSLEQRIRLSYEEMGALIGGDSDLIVKTTIYTEYTERIAEYHSELLRKVNNER